MPERAWHSNGNNWNLEVRQFSSISPRSIFESRFNTAGTESLRTPDTEAIQINVLDAFSAGGAQNRLENTKRTLLARTLLSVTPGIAHSTELKLMLLS